MDLIVGGGKYGYEAVKYLRRLGRSFIVIDRDRNCFVAKKLKLKFSEIEEIKEEGEYIVIGGLESAIKLVEEVKPELIFPTAPVHIAAEFVRIKHGFDVWNDVIDKILAGLPLKVVISVGRGTIVVSYNRDYVCVENCSSPDVCPRTKIKKPCPMYDLVEFAYPEAFILISKQLKPGLGALKGEDILRLLKESGKEDKIVVATACRCHGVITALRSKS